MTVWHPVWPSGDVLQGLAARARGRDGRRPCGAPREIGEATATTTAAAGAACAVAAGWTADAVTRESQQGVWFELAALARETAAQVVVIGARGAGGASRLGRVADAVVRVADRRSSSFPTTRRTRRRTRRSSSGSTARRSSEQAIRAAGALLPGRRAVVVHVGHLALAGDGAAIAAAAGLQAEALDIEAPLTDVVRPESAPWHQLDRVAGEVGAAAIVVGARGSGAVRRFLLGSTTSGLLHHARRPLLVIPEASLPTAPDVSARACGCRGRCARPRRARAPRAPAARSWRSARAAPS